MVHRLLWEGIDNVRPAWSPDDLPSSDGWSATVAGRRPRCLGRRVDARGLGGGASEPIVVDPYQCDPLFREILFVASPGAVRMQFPAKVIMPQDLSEERFRSPCRPERPGLAAGQTGSCALPVAGLGFSANRVPGSRGPTRWYRRPVCRRSGSARYRALLGRDTVARGGADFVVTSLEQLNTAAIVDDTLRVRPKTETPADA